MKSDPDLRKFNKMLLRKLVFIMVRSESLEIDEALQVKKKVNGR